MLGHNRLGTLAGVLICVLLALSAAPASAERILDFEGRIALQTDSDFVVTETLRYDFEGASRHGIYRWIPLQSGRGRAGRRAISVDVLSVSDEDGRLRPHRETRTGGRLRVRIGSPDRMVTGVQTYVLRYRVHGGVLFFDDHDELYWNFTGTDWEVPIEHAAVEVGLPPGGNTRTSEFICFAGPPGSMQQECEIVLAEASATIVRDRPLPAGQGLTLAASFPKGLIEEPTGLERLQRSSWLYRLRPLLLPVVVFWIMFALWRRWGRDEIAGDSVVVRYAPPADLSPAEAALLLHQSAGKEAITATLVDLAVRGHLRIRRIEPERFLFHERWDYALQATGPDEKERQRWKKHERLLYESLFAEGDEVKVSDLKNAFYVHVPRIIDAIHAEACGRKRLFASDPRHLKSAWYVTTLLTLFLTGLFMILWESPGATLAALVISAIIIAIFVRVMPRRTQRGRQLYEELLGLREFLLRVDRDRLERMGMRSTESFETTLPFALVLGVADPWAEAFVDLYTSPPEWFEGSGGGVDTRDLLSDLGRGLSSVGDAMTSVPSSSGGGFGGGGSVGGGGGGGGGGSW